MRCGGEGRCEPVERDAASPSIRQPRRRSPRRAGGRASGHGGCGPPRVARGRFGGIRGSRARAASWPGSRCLRRLRSVRKFRRPTRRAGLTAFHRERSGRDGAGVGDRWALVPARYHSMDSASRCAHRVLRGRKWGHDTAATRRHAGHSRWNRLRVLPELRAGGFRCPRSTRHERFDHRVRAACGVSLGLVSSGQTTPKARRDRESVIPKEECGSGLLSRSS